MDRFHSRYYRRPLRFRQLYTAGYMVRSGHTSELYAYELRKPLLLFLVWRRWRFTAGFACSAATVSAVSLRPVGLTQAKVYGQSLVSMSVCLSSRLDQFRYGISPNAMPNLRGLIFGLANTRFSTLGLQAATIAASVFLFLWVAVLAPKKQRGVGALLVAITVSALVITSCFTI